MIKFKSRANWVRSIPFSIYISISVYVAFYQFENWMNGLPLATLDVIISISFLAFAIESSPYYFSGTDD